MTSISLRLKPGRLLSQATQFTGSTSKIGTSITIMLMIRMIPKISSVVKMSRQELINLAD
jgi:hypothetical protein